MNQIDKVLDSIDMVDDVTLEYSFNIVDSMFKTYEKSAIILENYQGDDLSSFSIFQEGEIMDNFKERGKGMSVLMKILSALPRFVMAIIDKIKKNSSKSIVTLEDTLNKMPEKNKKALIALKYYNKNVSLPRKIFGSILDWIKTIFTSLSTVVGGGVISLTALFTVIGYKDAKNKAVKDMIANDVDKAVCEKLSKDEKITKLVSDLRKKFGNDQKKLTDLFNEALAYWNTKMTACKDIFGSDKKYEIDKVTELDIILEDIDKENPERSFITANKSLVTCKGSIIQELMFDNDIGRNFTSINPVNPFYDESKDKHPWTDTRKTMRAMLESIRTSIVDISKAQPAHSYDVEYAFASRSKKSYDQSKKVIGDVKTRVEKLINEVQSDSSFPSGKRDEFKNNTATFLQFVNELWGLVLKLETFNSTVVDTYEQIAEDVNVVNNKISKRVEIITSEMNDEKNNDKSTVKEYKKELKKNKKLAIVEDPLLGQSRFGYVNK